MKQGIRQMAGVCGASILAVAMTGCANMKTAKHTPTGPLGKVEVVYSDYSPQLGAEITDHTTVKIVTRNATVAKNVTGVLLAPLNIITGRSSPVISSKQNLRGDDFKTAAGEAYINPFYGGQAFRDDLQRLTDAHISQSDRLKSRYFKEKILVSRGATRLIYETLSGDASSEYRLNIVMAVWKHHESVTSVLDSPGIVLDALTGKAEPTRTVVDCNHESSAHYPLERWQESNAALLAAELSKAAEACKSKFKDQLGALLLK